MDETIRQAMFLVGRCAKSPLLPITHDLGPDVVGETYCEPGGL